MPYIEYSRACGNISRRRAICAGGSAAAVLVMKRTVAAHSGLKLRSCTISAAMVGTSGKPVTRSLSSSGRIFCGNANDFSSTRVAPSFTHISSWYRP